MQLQILLFRFNDYLLHANIIIACANPLIQNVVHKLYYINNVLKPEACTHYRRKITATYQTFALNKIINIFNKNAVLQMKLASGFWDAHIKI